MALRGNLRDFTVTQLLNLVNLAHKTGTLIIEAPTETARVSFREGKLAFAQIGQEDSHLAMVLYRSHRLTAGQYKAIQMRGPGSDKELGLLLINAGYLTQDEILGSLQSHLTEIVRRLFTWVEGFFRFDNDTLPPDDRISLRLDLENLIIEGSRQLREWEELQDEIPSLDMALKFMDRPGTNIRNVNLSVEEWRVVSFINPRNTIRQIARATKLNDMEIRRIVYALIQAGLVEVIRQEGAPAPHRASSPKGELPRPPTAVEAEEQKSLVNRLIMRIRAL